MRRLQKEQIIHDLCKKMVLLAGPRQAGKTTLAKEIAQEFSSSIYLNYDSLHDRKMILDESWLPSNELIILDEIHKMPKWKNKLKGLYDTKKEHQKILVTGSARLEIYHRVGDSLAGRYFLHRLLPLSPAECEKVGMHFSLDRFLERGGFPEPFLCKERIDADRWRLQYVDSLLRTDVLEFDNIQNLNAIKLIFDLLRQRIGSPISYSSIARDVLLAPNTVKKYIQILEALYIVFRVTPYSKNIARSLLKEPKIYFFDTGLVENNKLENLVAVSLLKDIFGSVDNLGQKRHLHYFHTKEGNEVDFAIIQDGKVQKMIEVKTLDDAISSNLRYFHERYGYEALQIIQEPKRERMDRGISLLSADHFLRSLDL